MRRESEETNDDDPSRVAPGATTPSTGSTATSDGVTRGIPVSARCVWEVTGGIIPGEADPAYTRRFWITSTEWNGGRNGAEQLLKLEAEAGAYARHLQLLCTVGRGVNWTRIDFVWF